MARKSKKSISNYFSNINWQESYTSLILGAIIVIILGLLVANYFTKKSSEIGTGEQAISTKQALEQKKVGKESYKVVVGDSLSAISEKVYGTMENWPVLAKVNNIANPNMIYPDTNLKTPSKEDAEKIRLEMSTTVYNVISGDTLFAISEKMYGDGSKWHTLAQANNVGLLPNGNPLIFAGTTLKVPR